MKKAKILLFMTWLTCLLSCSNSHDKKKMPEIDNDTEKIEIEDLTDQDLAYSTIYSNIEHAVLETNDESAIGVITNLEVTQGEDLIIFDRGNSKVLRFDSTGKYLNKIGMSGHANTEYVSPEIVHYDETSDNVVVYDGSKKCLLHYDLSGTLVYTTPLHKHIGDFAVMNNDEIAIYANYKDLLEEDQIAYNLEIIDADGNILRQYDSYSKEMENYHPSRTKNFVRNNEGMVFFRKFYSSILHSIDEEGLSPKYYIDFMSRQIPTEWLELKSSEEIERRILGEESDVAYCTDFHFTENGYIIKVVPNHGYIHYIYFDKKDPSLRFCAISMFNDISGLISSFISTYSHGKVYGIIETEIIDNMYSIVSDGPKMKNYKRFLQQKDYEITDQDLSIVKKMKNNQNPTIQICTLK